MCSQIPHQIKDDRIERIVPSNVEQRIVPELLVEERNERRLGDSLDLRRRNGRLRERLVDDPEDADDPRVLLGLRC